VLYSCELDGSVLFYWPIFVKTGPEKYNFTPGFFFRIFNGKNGSNLLDSKAKNSKLPDFYEKFQ
jgi:hypothetical protein